MRTWRQEIESPEGSEFAFLERFRWLLFISLNFFDQRTKSDDRLLKISQLDINLQSVSVTVQFPVRETTVASWWWTRTP